MDEHKRHYEYEVEFKPNNQIRIDCGQTSIITEYTQAEEKSRATQMSPAQLFFASALG